MARDGGSAASCALCVVVYCGVSVIVFVWSPPTVIARASVVVVFIQAMEGFDCALWNGVIGES